MAPKMGEAEHLRSLVRILFFLLSFLSGVHEVLTSWWGIVASSSTGTINNSAGNQSHAEPPPRPDFGDSANPLWSLFSKQAKTQDEARIQSLAGDMEGILVFVRLSSRILYPSRLRTRIFYRLACFLQFSLPSSSKVSKYCNRTPHNNRYITSSSRWRCCFKFRSKLHPSPRNSPSHLLPHLPMIHPTHHPLHF